MTDASFLPDDYLAQKAERRTNFISLTLFVVVMGAVFGAFLVTNRQWSQVKIAQKAVNAQFQEAAYKIDELNQLEQQRSRMLNKAELAIALVERVPRSILMAELINRMPPRLSLTEFEIKSTPEKPMREPTTAKTGRLSTRKKKAALAAEPERARTREESLEERKIEPPRFQIKLAMVGIAPTDLEVSRYMAELINYPLLRDVTLKYSVKMDLDGQNMQEFRIEMELDSKADIRGVEPLIVPRHLRDPLSDEIEFLAPESITDASGSADDEGDN